ncbi:MAG: sugar ABC transporter permease [Spirochaetaceae bacterium]|nr:sugar ABC transporter permease [Spirochaetaceae bacterium]
MKLGKEIEPYVYLLPSMVIMALFLGYPIIYNLVISFFQWNLRRPDRPFAGLSNYFSVLSDGKFPVILRNTLLWAGAGVASQMVFGITLALFADSLYRPQKYMRTIILLPWLIPGVVTALMWKWMFQADVGIINFLLMHLGITKNNILFISSPATSLPSLIFVNSWRAVPFWFLMITAALQDKPLDQIESARMDGARYPVILWHVILPHLSPVIASTGVLTTIWTLNYFDLIWTTTKGGPADATSTLPIYTYRLAFEFSDFGRSAALAMVSLIIVALVCIPYVRRMFSGLSKEEL